MLWVIEFMQQSVMEKSAGGGKAKAAVSGLEELLRLVGGGAVKARPSVSPLTSELARKAAVPSVKVPRLTSSAMKGNKPMPLFTSSSTPGVAQPLFDARKHITKGQLDSLMSRMALEFNMSRGMPRTAP